MTEKASTVSTSAQTQAQTASAEKDWKQRNAAEGGEMEPKEDEPIYFDTTIAKLVKRENSDGDEEWVEVLSDNLYPGEKLKRADDEEKAAEKDKKARKAAFDAAEDRKKDDKKA